MLHQSIKSWKPIWWHSDLSFLPPPTALDFPLDNTSTSLPGAVTLLARLWFQGVECRHEQTPIPKEKRLFHSTMSTVQYIIPGSMDHWWWGHTLQHPVMRTWGTWTLLSRWPPVITLDYISTSELRPSDAYELLQVYHANVHPKFPDGGKMTQHLESLSSEWMLYQ